MRRLTSSAAVAMLFSGATAVCSEPQTPPAAPKPSFPGAPATVPGDQLAWLLDGMLARHAAFTPAEITAHFHSSFLAKVPPAQLLAVLGQIGGDIKALAIQELQSSGSDQLTARVSFDGAPLLVKLHLDAATKQIDGLLFRPDAPPEPKPSSMAEAEKMIAALAPRAQFLVAALDHGTCKPIHELNARDELAVGSAFKLYVLIGLADRIAAGKQAWEDQLAIRDDWKSLPSGITQNEPAGTKLSIATLAERMISISDNTAADHLLYTVGRAQVEAALRGTGHGAPALDIPFLSTRELFLFKLGMPAADIQRYLQAPAGERCAFLDTTLAGKRPDLDAAKGWSVARHIDTLEWFASSEDLGRAMAALWRRAQDPKVARLLEVLSKNPGLPIDKAVWPYVGFKGGSEPGVLNLTYLLRRDDGRWFVVTLGLNSLEGGTVDEGKAFAITEGIIELLGAERPSK